MSEKIRLSDIAIICGLLALIAFGHICATKQPAKATGIRPLLMQGSGMAYGQPVDDRVNALENNARAALYELGAAQAGYSSYHSSGEYTYLNGLINSGFVLPNQSGRTLVADYSIAFYLPPGRDGFTLVAEPVNFALRPYMITENQNVVLLTPTVMDDPTEDWAEVRETEVDNLYSTGRYDYIGSLQLFSYDPVLDLRLNSEKTSYVIHSFKNDETGKLVLDDSLVYVDTFAAYMLGDTRMFE